MTVLVCCLLLIVLPVLSVSGRELRVSGASTILPILAMLEEDLRAQGLILHVSGGGSGRGVADVVNGESDLGMVSRALTSTEREGLRSLLIGLDALVLIVNAENTVNELSRQQVIALYTGSMASWSEVGGPDAPVTLLTKEVGRSTLDLFEDYTGLRSPSRGATSGRQITDEAYEIGSNLEGITVTGGLPFAIDYVSFGSAVLLRERGMPIKILRLDGVVPTEDRIRRLEYPIVRELNLVYREETPEVLLFIQYLASSAGRRRLVEVGSALGFVPASLSP